MSIGMNLSGISYYSMEAPFIDRFKMNAGFFLLGGQYHFDTPDPSWLDSNGWPIHALPDGSVYGFSVPLDPTDTGETHRFVLSYTGTGDFTIIGGHNVVRTDGQVTFDGDPTAIVEFTTSASDPVKDIHIVREDQVAAFNAGEIFTPEFLDKTSNWSVVRFMDWNQTNGSTITSWNQRETPASLHWDNVPIEVEVALGNKIHSDIWVNIPAMADDDYVRQLTTYVRDNLDPSLKLHIEYSNEMWNTGFAQTTYAQQQADALWGSQWFGNEIYYGYRSAQIMSIAQQVYGSAANDRLSGVLATFTAYTGVEGQIFDGVSRANDGSVSSLFKEYAITTYFGDQLGSTDATDQAKILQWAESGTAGITAALNELQHGGNLSSDFSLDNLMSYWQYQGQVAANHGLSLVAYEGGFSGYWFAWPRDEHPEIVDFINRLVKDPRFGDIYTKMAQNFTAAGGTELTVFNDVGGPTIWGPWGTTDTIYDDSPRYEALKALSTKVAVVSPTISPVVPPVVPVVTDPTHTSASIATMADGATTLTYDGTDAFTGTGNGIANTITGGDHGNHLYGLGGNDTLIGGAGADWLDGGTGADRMVGGVGNDTYIVDDAGDVVVENANEGIDEVRTTLASYALGADLENLTAIGPGSFTGTGNALDNVITAGDGGSYLYGLGGNDTLIGGAGADWLDGGTGADRMVGGNGNDTYIVDDAGDVVVEQAGGGTDLVRTSLSSYALGANVENLTFTGTGAFTGTGNELENVIYGSATAPNKLYGGAGNDMLYGGSGADYLDGGTGTDTMVGGDGNDVYIVRDSSDIVVEFANGGLDEVRSYATSYVLSQNVETLTFVGIGDFTGVGNDTDNVITGGSGNDWLLGGAGNDTLIGGAGNDVLDGGTGNDRMIGGTGDDAYYVDSINDRVLENVGEGYDTIYSSVSYTLPANVERLILTGTADLSATGNGAANTLIGNSGNNVLIGGGGADILTGGGGADSFVFRQGDLLTAVQTTDHITDFSRAEGDKIDFTALHLANAWQVQVGAYGSDWDVGVDLNGDGRIDVHLLVTSRSGVLVPSDFLI